MDQFITRGSKAELLSFLLSNHAGANCPEIKKPLLIFFAMESCYQLYRIGGLAW